MLHILTQYGASVHEVVSDRTITTLNVSRETYKSETTLRYFRILRDEGYVDFNLANDQGLSALLTAVRSNGMACQAIDFLASSGVSVSRINADGRTALHFAAEMATDVEPLRHLFEIYNINEVNRQDIWGWTPLHYAVVSQARMVNRDNGKIGFLLQKGADPLIMGRRVLTGRSHISHLVSEGVTPLHWAAIVGPDMERRFLEHTRAAGWVLNDEDDVGEAFYDAQEIFV
jgi:ankyrin repeat protein